VDDGKFVAGELLTAQDVSGRSMRVLDLSSIYFQADLDESEYANVRVDMPVTLTLDAFPDKEFKGKVSYIGKEGVKKTGGGIQIPVDITFDAGDMPFVPELSGDVEIISEEKPDVLVIDKKYARKKDGAYVIDILKDGKKVEQPIEVGLVGISTLEIKGGLAVGDTIVIPKQAGVVKDDTSHRSQ
jgi:HlyD family secretion protein